MYRDWSEANRLKLERISVAIAVGLALFAVSYFADWLLDRLHISNVQTVVDNLIVGFCGAVAAYLWARYEAERQARAREKMILMTELNHHIRKAVSLLGKSAALENGPDKLKMIDAAIDRVDRVLTDLVPTVGETSSPRFNLEDNPPHFENFGS
jgi:hypothetical protein